MGNCDVYLYTCRLFLLVTNHEIIVVPYGITSILGV